MNTLVLVAASGLAREVLAAERRLGRYDEVLILDDDPQLWGTSIEGVKVVGPVEMAAEAEIGDILVCAGSGQVRRLIVQRLTAMGVTGGRYGRLVHPSIDLPPRCSVGPGTILLAGVVMTTNVYLHRHVVVMPNVTLTHDDVLHDFATLCAGVSLAGGVTIGEAAYVGMNASVREGLTVGPDSTLGMGAVLLEDLPAFETWVGTPASAVPSGKHLVP
jgi:sugar O-acyltransferase (sialic acid O-acetyltransferase NeuD family)